MEAPNSKYKKGIDICYNKPASASLMILSLFLYFIFYALYLPQAGAQGVGLRLSPSVLRVKLEAPTELNAPISIENLEDRAIDLKTEFRLFKAGQDGDGQVEYLPTKDNNSDIFKNIALLDGENNLSRLALGPGQKKDLILKINIPEGEAVNDYYFSVIFTRIQDVTHPASDSSEQHSISRINTGVAMNVLLSIQDQNNTLSSATLEEFSAPRFTENGPVHFIVKIANKGSNYIIPKGSIEITNMFGQLIGRVDVPATNVLANSSRYLNNSSQSALSSQQSGVKKVLWNEKFLFGFYTAKIKIDTAPNDTVLTKTIHFTALPFRLIISVLTFAIIFLIIRRRVKRKMSGRE